MSRVSIDRDFLVNTLSGLVRINSINPNISPDGPGELEISQFVAEIMGENHLEVHVQELAPSRFNVVGVRKGRKNGKKLLLNAHMDTVGTSNVPELLTPTLKDGRLYGRGSQDMKGGLAAMLAAARWLEEAQIELDGDLILAAVADEEYASLGTSELIKDYPADAAIITEPTDLRLCLAQRGFIVYEIEVTGRAAHGSRYDEGIDAIAHMGRFLTQFEKLCQELIQRPAHPLVGPPSMHASRILGGTEVSTYPARCWLEIERRTSSWENDAPATAELTSILDGLSAEDPEFHGTIKTILSRPPFEIKPEAEIARCVADAMHAVQPAPLPPSGASFWTDAALLTQAGIPTVIIGPSGHGLHTSEEWVDLQSCCDLAEILVHAATAFCDKKFP